MKIAIYLAGTIKKGHENPKDSYWSEEDISDLRKSLHSYDVAFLNPAVRSDDLSDQRSVFGRDMLQVFSSDFVFVDARDRRGLGVGAEMMWAKMNNIPVITWAPEDTHYRKNSASILGVTVNNFIHPFVEALSDHIVEDLSQGAKWIDQVITNPSSYKVKTAQHIHSAMEYYRKTQLDKDIPMRELLETI